MEPKDLVGRAEVTVKCSRCGVDIRVHLKPRAPAPGGAPRSAPKPEPTRTSSRGQPQMPPGKSVGLSVTQGPLKGKVFPITKPRVVLGRAESDVVVDDPDVSRKHCALELYGVKALLVDLGSTNGTYVNDERVEQQELSHLTEFRIGSTVILFSVTDKV